MENLENFNLSPYVQEMRIKKGISKESNSEYYYFDIMFSNNYSKRIFINREMLFPINDLINRHKGESVEVKRDFLND